MPKAIVLFSGGLDSCLAVLILLRQQILVDAVRFITPFGCNQFKGLDGFLKIVTPQGFKLLDLDIHKDFLEIVKRPTFGYGKNMNPCIDCKILMLKMSAQLMKECKADFIATGEVIGQRPMSQQRHIFNLMEKQTGLKGIILRPLSAKLLPITIAEQTGMVDRDKLYDITGRGRSRQILLAKELGMKEYAAPAGGCLLTEPNYAFRLKELLHHKSNPTKEELESLRVGRHFRLPSGTKVIVGRNQDDNDRLLSLGLDSIVLEPCNTKGPVVLLIGDHIQNNDLIDAGGLCARYSDTKGYDEVEVKAESNSKGIKKTIDLLKVSASHGKELERYMIKL